MPPVRIAITGASGHIGRHLAAQARRAGLEVVALARHGDGTTPYELAGPVSPGIFAGVRAVVHLAWAGLDAEPAEGVNVAATRRLLAAAREAGVERVIFVSSQSARPDALNRYGRDKWAAEEECRRDGAVVVRPGLVYGGTFTGLWARLLRLATTPVLPLVGGDAPLHPVHVDDLAAALVTLATDPALPARTYCVGAARPLSFRDFLALAARVQGRRRPMTLPVPLGLALALCRLTALVPGLPHVAPERVLGLAGLHGMDTSADLAALGLPLRPLEDGLAAAAPRRRRALLAEGRALLGYVLRTRPHPAVLRLYLRALHAKGLTRPAGLPPLLARWPAATILFDPPDRSNPLGARFRLATDIAGATPEGARVFLAQHRQPPAAGMVRLLALALAEAALLVPRHLIALMRR